MVHSFKNDAYLQEPFPLLIHISVTAKTKHSSGRSKWQLRKICTWSLVSKFWKLSQNLLESYKHCGKLCTSASFASFIACPCLKSSKDMAREKLLVWWEGNHSKCYDNTVEEIWLSNIVAINKTAVVQPGPVTCWKQHQVWIYSKEGRSAAVRLFHLATQHPQSHPESEHELIRVVSLCSLGESVGSMLTHPGSRLHRRIVLSDNSLWSCRNKQEWIWTAVASSSSACIISSMVSEGHHCTRSAFQILFACHCQCCQSQDSVCGNVCIVTRITVASSCFSVSTTSWLV